MGKLETERSLNYCGSTVVKEVNAKPRKLILIKLQGGLGNQMFQYAIASILGEKFNVPIFLEMDFFDSKEKKPGFTPRKFELDIFKCSSYSRCSDSQIQEFTKLSFLNKVKKSFGFNYPKIYEEKVFAFNPEVFLLKPPIFLKGYFQSYKYYENHETFIKSIFRFSTDKIDVKNQKIISKIKTANSVSVHIRRGDFVNDEKTESFHGICSPHYYLKAINLMVSKMTNIQLVFFSDDMAWVKEKFEKIPYPKLFVDHNKGENSWKDMFLMSSCSGNIIANSSFSWWGAWLNNHPDKIVIAPEDWFANGPQTNDLIPEQWIRI